MPDEDRRVADIRDLLDRLEGEVVAEGHVLTRNVEIYNHHLGTGRDCGITVMPVPDERGDSYPVVLLRADQGDNND